MVRRKKIISYCLLGLLFASLAGSGFIYTTNAFVDAPPPLTDKPAIILLTPIDYVAASVQTTILFNVTMPSTWEYQVYTYEPATLWGAIRNVTCTLDQEQIMFDNSVYGRGGNPHTFGTSIYLNYYPTTIPFSCTINESIPGPHSLTIIVGADTLCTTWDLGSDGYHYPVNHYIDVSNSETFTFEVVAAPFLTSLSIENKSYATSYLPLTLETNGTAMWIGYSLDNLANVTISSNAALSNLAEGNHSLVIYANDTFGNMGKLETVYFNVVLPTPTPSPIPAPSPTISPTIETTLEPTTTSLADSYSVWIPYSIVGLVAVIIITVAVYFVRHKRRE